MPPNSVIIHCTSEIWLSEKEILNSQWNPCVASGYASQNSKLSTTVVILMLVAAVSCVFKDSKILPKWE